MAIETWLDFYNLFHKFLCIDSVLAMGGDVIQPEGTKEKKKNP